MYRALGSGEADVISAFSSDGRIAADDLVVLGDPKGALPPYDAVLLIAPGRADDARLARALAGLDGAISVEACRRPISRWTGTRGSFRRPRRPRCWRRRSSADRRRFGMEDHEVRAALDRHWAASDANDLEAEHQIYQEDAVLDYPQSGERIRGRQGIQASRAAQPARKRFTVRRIVGAGDLWVTEYVITYDGRPSYTVSIMEFRGEKVARETQYFGDPFEPGPSRAQWVERAP
jgi:hypothetical protein